MGVAAVSITNFNGEHAFLSNFYRWTFRDDLGVTWESVEHYYQAHKVVPYSEGVRQARSPGSSKRLGRQLSLRSDWEQMKVRIMHNALRWKFAPGSHLATLLLATGDEELVEGNNWCDQIWGDCSCPVHRDLPGQNLLGYLLNIRRQELRQMAIEPGIHEDQLELRRHHNDFAAIQEILTKAEEGEISFGYMITAIRNIVG